MIKLFNAAQDKLVYEQAQPTFINPDLSAATHRFLSIDILRGAIMLIMALDHVRHFLHQPAMVDEPTNLATTTPVLFFTRWITHFCAPVFIFLSGVSAYISGQKKTRQELSIFLIKRGFWLVLVELFIISFSWSFDPLYNKFFLQVIWAIGWSMMTRPEKSLHLLLIILLLVYKCSNPEQGLQSVWAEKYFRSPVQLKKIVLCVGRLRFIHSLLFYFFCFVIVLPFLYLRSLL